MAGRLNQHGSEKFDELFEENTGAIGDLSDIVDKHAGDAVFLGGINDGSVKGADGGEADFIGEMNSSDPDDFDEERDDDSLSGQAASDVDITGTAAGIARGFGSHVPLDIGSGGFQIEEIPDRALSHLGRTLPDEELDDYDDDDPNNGKYDPRELESLSIPGGGTSNDDLDQDEDDRDRV